QVRPRARLGIALAPHVAIGQNAGQEAALLCLGAEMQQRGGQDAMADQVHAQRRAAARVLFMENGLALQGQRTPPIRARPAQPRPSVRAQRVFPSLAKIQIRRVGDTGPLIDETGVARAQPGAQARAKRGVVGQGVETAGVYIGVAHCRRMFESRATFAQVPMSCLMNAAKACGSLPMMSSPRSANLRLTSSRLSVLANAR